MMHEAELSSDDEDYNDGNAASDSGDEDYDAEKASKKAAPVKATAAKGKPSKEEPPAEEEIIPLLPLDKRVMEELLLVYQSVVGTDLETGGVLRAEYSVEFLSDLQNVLSKDDNDSRHVIGTLNSWKFVSKKLIPLLKLCKDDRKLIEVSLKILFQFTKVWLISSSLFAEHLLGETGNLGSPRRGL
jgi:hypothetical protein